MRHVGYYTLEGNLLMMMTDGAGKPFRGRSGEPMTHKLRPVNIPTLSPSG